jgi:hypothetical protein
MQALSIVNFLHRNVIYSVPMTAFEMNEPSIKTNFPKISKVNDQRMFFTS